MLVYVVATLAIAAIGIADGRHSLSARTRIILTFLIFAIAAMAHPLYNIRVLSFSVPEYQLGFMITPLAVFFTSLCCVG